NKSDELLGEFATISRDGLYCSYVINGPEDYTIVRSTKNNWKHKLPGKQVGFFSGDNRYYIFQTKDSLCYLPLKEGLSSVIKDVVTYNMPFRDDRNEWLAVYLKDKTLLLSNLVTGKDFRFSNVNKYSFSVDGAWFSCQLNNEAEELAIVKLSNGNVRVYEHVKDYSFDETTSVLLLKTENEGKQGLQWAEPMSGKITLVWTANPSDSSCIENYTIDKAGQRLVFMVQKDSFVNRSVWYYKKGMNKAVQKVLHDPESKTVGMELTGAPVFSDDGRYIIVSMCHSMIDKRKAEADAVLVDVWNYQDTFLMSAQVAGTGPGLDEWLREKVYKFSMPAEGTDELSYLSGEHETLFLAGGGSYACINRQVITDRFWEDWCEAEIYLIALKDGHRMRLEKGGQFSPDGTWLLCYDSKTGQYLRYDIDSKKYTDLSGAGIYFGGENEFYGAGRQPQLPRGIAGWIEGGRSLLVYDHYDIWQLDITGKKPAVNLTNGRRNKIRFEITRISESQDVRKTFYSPQARLVLTAVNMENKDNGFYALTLGSQKRLEQLYMGPKVLYLGGLNYGQSFWGQYSLGCKPLKARDADTWLLIQQSTTEAPNYYVSYGMKEFKALTNFQPHQKYNWLKSELVNFKQKDGSNCKGILYKPENFDPSKKYPVLINYYEQFSLCLNQYPVLNYIESAHINIPWFVSRGYLVFLPDIYFNKDWAGDAAVNAVEGAASWLSQQSCVDSTKMGIAGHSWGGTLTNYIVTHTSRFAAAFCGAAGASDVISRGLLPHLTIDGSVDLRRYELELLQPLWEKPERWIKASPIMSADKITSPYLIFHCAIEGVPFQQAAEMFVAMRRLGKKVWLLQYDESDHTTAGRDSKDLTIRVTQFFDHYLKGAPPPIWMTVGIRAQLKQIETGYEFDTTGRQP
ncbi:MAG: S9 family peptidase, partial [Chitinophagaceae bacterium]|nr:S9 family peptidase [Chitinophagaceae bacterium]